MDDTVTFEDVSKHRDAAVRMFEDQRQKLLSWIPGPAEVLHVGSTSFTGGLSRGDVDIQIRVRAEDYAAALAAIAPHYAVNPDGYTSEDAASFKDDDLNPPVGLILTVVDGSGDALWRFRDALLARPDLAEEYSALKAQHQDGSLAAYRADKHLFVRKVIRTRQYATLARSLPWRYRPIRLQTKRLLIFDVQDGDAGRLARYHEAGDLPGRWGTDAFWLQRLARLHARKAEGGSLQLIWLPKQEPEGDVIGTTSLGAINAVPGTGACELTCTVGPDYPEQGYTEEALEAVLGLAFADLRLHRVRTTYPPDDHRRAALLHRLGFQVEGFAPDYIWRGGRWQGHLLCALGNPGG